jgi:hypothetical protein
VSGTTHEATLQRWRASGPGIRVATQMTPRRLHQFHSGDLLDRSKRT